MATAARLGDKRFGHETDRPALLRRDFFDALLEDDVHVRHGNRLGMDKIDLMLAPAPFSFAGFHWNAGCAHEIAHRTEKRLIPPRLQGLVIDSIITRRG